MQQATNRDEREKRDETLVSHIEALRKMLLKCVIATVFLYPLGFYLTPYAIKGLVCCSFPENLDKLYYFAPMEVFWVQLKLGLIIALMMAYPWNIRQAWHFLLPALYRNERKALGWGIFFSSFLFFSGVAFCIWLVLPLMMNFSGGFATPELQPMLGLAHFLNLAGMLMFAFGVLFQSPMIVFLCVRFGLVSPDALAKKRPYIMTAILILSAILTPPDVVSQLMLAIPTWLLFELGLFVSGWMGKKDSRLKLEDV